MQKFDPQEYNNALESANQKKLDKNLGVAMPLEERNKLTKNGKIDDDCKKIKS